MNELMVTDYVGIAQWLGVNPVLTDLIAATGVERLDLSLEGIAGDYHAGATRPSCVRVANLYPEGTEIRNTRQITILSSEELAEIARGMQLSEVSPEFLGANIVLSGIPDLTHLPPSSRLQAEGGATLVVDRINLPCNFPARAIEKVHPGTGRAFKAAAAGRRGVTAWVERAGSLRIGERIRLFLPAQRAWQPGPEGA